MGETVKWMTASGKGTLLLMGVGLGMAGLLASRPLAERAIAAPAPKQLCFEAEDGKITAPVTLFKATDCSGGGAIEVKEGVNPVVKEGEPMPKLSGDVVLTLNVAQAGTYQLYARCWWMDGCGNSFYLTFDGNDRMTLSDGDYKRWHWVRGPRVHLTAGKHTLKIANAEDGARMDQIFLTSDFRRIPVGKEKVTPGALIK